LAPNPWNVLEQQIQPGTATTKTKRVFCFGSGDGDEDYLESCGWTLAPMEEADLIVARGTFTIKDGSTLVHKKHDGEEAYYQAYHEQLTKGARRKVPMLVANPDKIRPDADKSPMPGTIGTDYEAKLRELSNLSDPSELVKYIGKPFADVYEIALRGKDKSKVCMIGDALETDVAGGSAAGIDTIWVVQNGIHNVDVERQGNGSLQTGCSAVVATFNQNSDKSYAKGRKLMPTVVLPTFAW
jgi:ribonucleotide monophosphatase NagD (HAD superfamily)